MTTDQGWIVFEGSAAPMTALMFEQRGKTVRFGGVP